MDTNLSPQDLALDLTSRSTCRYQMAATLVNRGRIISWGWNHLSPRRLNNFLSVHAELHALSRANPARIAGSSLFIAGKNPSGNVIVARPCDSCMQLAIRRGISKIYYSTPSGWLVTSLSPL